MKWSKIRRNLKISGLKDSIQMFQAWTQAKISPTNVNRRNQHHAKKSAISGACEYGHSHSSHLATWATCSAIYTESQFRSTIQRNITLNTAKWCQDVAVAFFCVLTHVILLLNLRWSFFCQNFSYNFAFPLFTDFLPSFWSLFQLNRSSSSNHGFSCSRKSYNFPTMSGPNPLRHAFALFTDFLPSSLSLFQLNRSSSSNHGFSCSRKSYNFPTMSGPNSPRHAVINFYLIDKFSVSHVFCHKTRLKLLRTQDKFRKHEPHASVNPTFCLSESHEMAYCTGSNSSTQ